jgi:hypothetical protein
MKYLWAMAGFLNCAGQNLSGRAQTSEAVARTLEAVARPQAGQMVERRSEIVLHCNMSDAEVTLDRVPQGLCDDFDGDPRGLKLPPGGHLVQVEKRGFVTWNTWLQAEKTRVVMHVNLTQQTGVAISNE